MGKNDGGPAFPQVKTTRHCITDPDKHSVGGMALRDYFAAKVIQGFYSDNHNLWQADGSPHTLDTAAELAYKQADAMLAAREVAK